MSAVAGSAGAVAGEAALRCGNCKRPMRRLALSGHYGGGVELDVCEACDWVWFDGTETAQLNGPSLLALIGEMARSRGTAHEMLRADPRCSRCDGRLRLVQNQSRWGRSSQLQCERRHGAYQTFAQFLHEKGLARAMSKVDRARLIRDRGRIDCVNCGGLVEKGDERCRWCTSVPSLLDVARLARALDPLELLEPQPLHGAAARQQALQCAACGAALSEGQSVSCPQCGATLAITDLAEANAAVQKLAPALREAAAKPSPQVVRRRLDALNADLPKQREYVAGLQRQARAQGVDVDDDGSLGWSALWKRGTSPMRAIVIAMLAWAAWRVWR